MNHSRVTIRRRALASVTLAIVLAGCSARPARPADDYPIAYYNIGDTWQALKRSVHLYQCRSGSKVCEGPASYVNVMYRCRCE